MLHYYIGILKKLTPGKAFNFLKLAAGFHLSRLVNRPVQLGLPVFISIEPTTSCNLRCPQCPSGLRQFTRDTGMLQKPLFENVILQMRRHLHSLTFYFQGEPYLHPSFLEMVSFAGSNGIYTITSTNAHYLNEVNARQTVLSGLDKLVISVDGVTQEVYSKYRVGGDFHKVVEGTREVIRQKKILKSRTPHIVWQFVVFGHNEHQVEQVKKMGRETGVDEVKIKTAQVYDFENGHDLIPRNEKYSRYKKLPGGSHIIKSRLLNKCWRMWQGCVVTWDGKIVPCCFDKDAKYKLGDLQTQSFKKVWFSPAYNQFRRSILKGRNQVDICTNCTEGATVWADA